MKRGGNHNERPIKRHDKITEKTFEVKETGVGEEQGREGRQQAM